MQGVQITLPIGSIIHNRYRIEALLGRGGFGAVYRVHDERVKGNIFALKEVIDPSLEERECFAFECDVLKRADHPGLPCVYQEFEDVASQRAYMLMDFVDGPNLEHLRLQQPEKRFPLARALQLMAPIFDAVSYLHQQDPPIIHRDIKPANIIVPREGNATVLVDLGIAKEYDQEGTTTAIRRCSPGYGAPEQYARGTDQRTDVYGLAATVYVLLTGVVPADAFYRMTQLGSKNLDPLESPRALSPDILPEIENTIICALSINSNDRFATVDAFWQALQIASDYPTLFPPEPSNSRVAASQQMKTPSPVQSSNTEVTMVVYPISSGRERIYPPHPAKHRHLPLTWLLFFAFLALLALGTGVLFGTHFFARAVSPTAPVPRPSVPGSISGAAATPLPSALPTLAPTAIPTAIATPTPLPTVAPTPVPTVAPAPTPAPTAAPAPAPVSYPQLSSQYNGRIVDQYTSPATTSSMSLSHVQQKRNASYYISGYFSVGPELLGNGNFTGLVTQDEQIQFVVASYNNLLPLLFLGTIHPDGSMQGTYCSAHQNGNIYQCDKVAGGYGTWQVVPAY